MDATLSYGTPRINQSGTLLEGIALWGELKQIATIDEIKARALEYCDWAVSMGLLAIRSHVDTCDPDLKGVQALLDVRETVRPWLDLQLVAFPQDGLYRDPQAQAQTLRALDMGVDVVGGIPHFERTMEEGRASVQDLCRMAAERGLPIDLHCDETDDPMSRHIETLTAEVIRHGLQGRAGWRGCPCPDDPVTFVDAIAEWNISGHIGGDHRRFGIGQAASNTGFYLLNTLRDRPDMICARCHRN